MSLNKLYHLKEHEIDDLYRMFAECFKDDDLYHAIYEDDRKRSIFLKHFFRNYIQLIRKYCYFVADSPALNSVMVVFDSTKENHRYFLKALWMNVKMLYVLIRLHSWQGIRHLMECWDMFTSRWLNDIVTTDYLHMDLLCTKESVRGQGFGSRMIEHLMKEARERGCDITMETHHSDNLKLYEKEGFKLISTISREQYHLKQYNLLYRVERGV